MAKTYLFGYIPIKLWDKLQIDMVKITYLFGYIPIKQWDKLQIEIVKTNLVGYFL